MNSFIGLTKGLLWAVAIGIVAFFYGYYGVASGWFLGTLGVLVVASLGLPFVFRNYSTVTAVINYEMCLLALWHGHLLGTTSLGGGVDIAWFCISFFWPWAFFAVVGGILAGVIAHHNDCPNQRTTRIAAVVLLVAAGLVASGFTHLCFSREQPIVMFRAVRFFLRGIAFSPDGKTIATVGGFFENKYVRLWDAANGRSLGECERERANYRMENAALQCFGSPPLISTSSYLSDLPNADNKIVIQTWDLATRKLKRRVEWSDSTDPRRSVFSHDGRWFVYSNENLRAFDLQEERLVVDMKRPENSEICCLAISPARDQLACATSDKKLEIWDLQDPLLADGPARRFASVNTSKRRAGPSAKEDTPDQVSCLDFSPDGRFLAYGTEGGTIEQIEVGQAKTNHTISCFANSDGVDAIKFSPNGSLLACAGGNEGTTIVFDTKRWKIVATLKVWGAYRTTSLTFSSDGRHLATGDANGLVGIWNTAGWTDR